MSGQPETTTEEPRMDDLIRQMASRGQIPVASDPSRVAADERPRDAHGRFAAPADVASEMDAAIRGWGSSAEDAASAAAPAYTQAEADAIVADRLDRQRGEHTDLQAKAARLAELEAAP